jgi:hypothetical protein
VNEKEKGNEKEKEKGSSKKKLIIAVVIALLAIAGVIIFFLYMKIEYVEITLPAEFVGDQNGDIGSPATDGLDVKFNEDGSMTYRMPKTKHEELMRELTADVERSLYDMTNSSDLFSSITHNENYTEFTVTCNSDSVGLSESISRVALYYIGGFYNLYNGTPADNIKVIYLDQEGNLIMESNSKDDDAQP